jgi:hypothetical protein
MTKDQALLLTMVSYLKKKNLKDIREKKNPVTGFGGHGQSSQSANLWYNCPNGTF